MGIDMIEEASIFRRVQRTGKGSLFITLPKDWARRNGLDKGSTVFLEERRNGSLNIRVREARRRAYKVTVRVPRSKMKYVEWGITGAYLLGFDTITVRGSGKLSLEERESIREVVDKLVGLEIVDERSDEVKLQCMIDLSFMDPVNLFRRINSLVTEMVQNTLSLLERYDEGVHRIVLKRDDEVDKLYFLLIRTLRTAVREPSLADKLKLKPIDLLDYRIAAEYLEEIGDMAVEITGRAKVSKTMFKRESINRISSILRDIQAESLLTFVNKSVKNLEMVQSLSLDLEGELRHLSDGEVDKEVIQLIKRIGDRYVDLADLVVPREIILEEGLGA